MQKYNVELLKLAREARFITQEELSQLLDIEQGTLSKVEKGILLADEGLIEKISKTLDFPITFFYQEKRSYQSKAITGVKFLCLLNR